MAFVRATRVARAAVLAAFALGASGCGGVYYAVEATGASSKLEEARTLGAEKLAPYEYTYAKEHLTQAQVEASEASYSDAADYAEVADTYAQKAIDVARAKRAKAEKP